MDVFRHAGGFAAEQQDIVGREAVIEIRDGRTGRKQHETMVIFAAARRRIPAMRVPDDRHGIEIVHSGAAEGAVGDREPGRLDDMRRQCRGRRRAAKRSRYFAGYRVRKGDGHDVAWKNSNRGTAGEGAAPHCGCRRGHTCTLAARVPIKLSRNASPLTFPRPGATGPSAACLPPRKGTAVRSADGMTGNTKEGRGCDSNLIGGANAPRFSLHCDRDRRRRRCGFRCWRRLSGR